MKLEAAKKKYKGDWLAFKFTNVEKNEGRVLLHERDRHNLHKKIRSRKNATANLYITFAGAILPKDFAIILTFSKKS